MCGATASRMLFAPAIHFKGSGFHNTDYGTRRRPVSEDGGGGSGGGGEGGSSNGAGKTESGTAKSSDAGDSGGGGKTVGLDKVSGVRRAR